MLSKRYLNLNKVRVPHPEERSAFRNMLVFACMEIFCFIGLAIMAQFRQLNFFEGILFPALVWHGGHFFTWPLAAFISLLKPSARYVIVSMCLYGVTLGLDIYVLAARIYVLYVEYTGSSTEIPIAWAKWMVTFLVFALVAFDVRQLTSGSIILYFVRKDLKTSKKDAARMTLTGNSRASWRKKLSQIQHLSLADCLLIVAAALVFYFWVLKNPKFQVRDIVLSHAFHCVTWFVGLAVGTYGFWRPVLIVSSLTHVVACICDLSGVAILAVQFIRCLDGERLNTCRDAQLEELFCMIMGSVFAGISAYQVYFHGKALQYQWMYSIKSL